MSVTQMSNCDISYVFLCCQGKVSTIICERLPDTIYDSPAFLLQYRKNVLIFVIAGVSI